MAETVVTSLRLKKDHYQQVKKMADCHGISVAKYMREAVLERLEDEADYHDAMTNLNASHGETVSRDEIRQCLGMH